MKNNIIFSMLMVFAIAAKSQKTTFTWAQEIKRETDLLGLVVNENNELIKISSEPKKSLVDKIGAKNTTQANANSKKRGSTLILTKYGAKLNEVKSVTFETGDDDNRINKFIQLKKNSYLLYDNYDKNGKSTTYYAQPMNMNSLNRIGRVITVGNFEAINGGFLNGYIEEKVELLQSKDSSKFLVIAKGGYVKKENRKWTVIVYDENMKKLWDKTVEIPYSNDEYNVLDNFVTNEGEVCFLIKKTDKESKKDEGAAKAIKLFIFNNTLKQPQEISFSVENKVVNSVELISISASELSVFGLYGENTNTFKAMTVSSGYFLGKSNRTTNSVEIIKKEDFPKELVELVSKDAGQASTKEKNYGISTLKLKDIYERGNNTKDYILESSGDFDFEREKMFEITNNGNNGTTIKEKKYLLEDKYDSHQRGDIIDINVKPTGASTFTRIPKFQYTHYYDGAVGYFSIIRNGDLFFFYNDENDNYNRDLSKGAESCKPLDDKTCRFVMAKVDAKGNLTREIVFDNLKYTVCTNVCRKLSNNKFCMYAQSQLRIFSPTLKEVVGYLEIE